MEETGITIRRGESEEETIVITTETTTGIQLIQMRTRSSGTTDPTAPTAETGAETSNLASSPTKARP